MKKMLSQTLLWTLITGMIPCFAEEPETDTSAAATFLVVLPEQIDREWYWILYSDIKQHVVQSKIETALIRAGMDVIDISAAELPEFDGNWNDLTSQRFALKIAKQLEADYVITGFATATKASESEAYGINVVRVQADVTAKIVRVSDGKIIDIFDASYQEGGESVAAASKNALRKASGYVGGRIGRWSISLREE